MKRALFLISALLVALSSVAQKKIPHAVKTYNEATGGRMESVLPKVKGYNC